LDFSKAQYEPGAAVETVCANCKQPLSVQYWTVGTASLCERCAALFKAGPPPEGAVLRVFKAVLFGAGAGLAGATLYGLIIYFAKVELALITILIGWMVGRAVKAGSEGRGGLGYQVLSAVMTYVCCMLAYVPTVVEGSQTGENPLPLAVAVLIAPFAAVAIPFTGELGVLGTLILAFGVWRGFREPAKVVVEVLGPFDLATRAA
jgi:hypothetical protein